MADRSVKKKVVEEIAGYADGELAKGLKAKYRPKVDLAKVDLQAPLEEDVAQVFERDGRDEDVKLQDGTYVKRPIPSVKKAEMDASMAKGAALEAPFKDRFEAEERKAMTPEQRLKAHVGTPGVKLSVGPIEQLPQDEGLVEKLKAALGMGGDVGAVSAEERAALKAKLQEQLRQLESME